MGIAEGNGPVLRFRNPRTVVRLFHVFFCLTAFIATSAFASTWGWGVQAGFLYPQQELGIFWEGSPRLGAALDYPFHPKLPVALQINISHHQPKVEPSPPPGYRIPKVKSWLAEACLVGRYTALETNAADFQVLTGICNTAFWPYETWPPRDNASEMEIGIVGGGAVEKPVGKRIALGLDVTHTLLFTLPHRMQYTAFNVRVLWKLASDPEKAEK